VNHSLNQLIQSLNEKLKLFLSISFGIFLFILFFQPFPLTRFDFIDKLIFVAGLGAIVFVFMFIVRIVIPWIFQKEYAGINEPVYHSSLSGFAITVLSSIASVFYLRYVGFVSISFYITIKVILIFLVPPVILRIIDSFTELRLQNESLVVEKKIIQKQIERNEADILNKSIEFISETNTDSLNLQLAEVALIKSADNYVEIVYKEGESLKKKLIRNTLKNIEHQLKEYSIFIRCHRICIVNMHYIEKLDKKFNNHCLKIKGYQEEIPVSRQYLIKLKEVL